MPIEPCEETQLANRRDVARTLYGSLDGKVVAGDAIAARSALSCSPAQAARWKGFPRALTPDLDQARKASAHEAWESAFGHSLAEGRFDER